MEIINNPDYNIDAIVVDGTLPGQNILNFLTSYKNEYLLSRTIILDNIKLDCYNLSASQYQLFNVVPKNYKINELIYSLKEIKSKQEKYNYKKISVYEKVAEMLKKLGIAPDKNGFHYLRKAIYECYMEPSLLTSITKEIYPVTMARMEDWTK